MPPALLLFLKIALATQSPLWFHPNFRIFFSFSMKNVIGILTGIALNLYITLGSMIFFKILFFPIQEHEIAFQLFMSSSISFTNVL